MPGTGVVKRIRTFIAVELDQALRRQALGLQKQLARIAGSDVKWAEPENLHVTLLFLGEVNDVEIPRIFRIAEQAAVCQPPFTMSLEMLGAFPSIHHPRVLWIGVGSGAQELIALHDRLEPPLSELGYRREERKYTPHITLGRVKAPGGQSRLSSFLAQHSGFRAGSMLVEELALMASELTPSGPLYTILGRAHLGHKTEQ